MASMLQTTDSMLSTARAISEGLMSFCAGTIDFIIRTPFTLVTSFLYAIQYILETFVYLTLDLTLYSIYELMLLILNTVVWMLRFTLLSLINAIATISTLTSSTAIAFVSAIDCVTFSLLFPIFDALYWPALAVTTLVLLLFVVGPRFQVDQERMQELWDKYDFRCLALLPVVCAVFDIWRKMGAVMLTYVFHPAIYLGLLFGASFGIYIFVRNIYMASKDYIDIIRSDFVYHLSIIVSYAKLYFQVKLIQLRQRLLKSCVWTQLSSMLFRSDQPNNLSDCAMDKSGSECVICFEERPFVKLLPCQHSAICSTCISCILEKDHRCPLCRGAIQRIEGMYLS